jgi:multicomponent Na+:H+ antiporter subunit D
VSAFISALVSTVAAYALIRIVFIVFSAEFLLVNGFAQTVLVAGAVVSIVLGSVLAVTQRELKRMLAYSSISQFGLIVGAIAVANGTALTGATIHLVGHAVMKGGLFLTCGLIATATGARTVEEYEGLAERVPLAAGAFAVLALAMVGVPPAVGFVGKWYIALGAVEAEAWTLAVVILVSTLLTLAYFLRVLERMYFREATSLTPESSDVATDGRGLDPDPGTVSAGMQAVVVLAAVLAIVLGAAAFEYGQLLEPTIERLLS